MYKDFDSNLREIGVGDLSVGKKIYQMSEAVAGRINAYNNSKDNKELIAGQNILSLLTVNGIRIILEDGSWGLIRASSNSPNLVVVCESPISLERMKEIFYSLNDILTKFPEIILLNLVSLST